MSFRILIADDNAAFRKALRQLLQAVDNWEILEARDGEDAVAMAAELRPNVIVLDLAMPHKDGLAAAKEISSLLPDTPVLMCTMHMSSLVKSEAQKSGVRQVFSKADSSLLLPAIQQLLASEPPLPAPHIPETIPPPAIAAEPVRLAPASPQSPTDPDSSSPPPPKNVA